ncbi:hypothetical protein GCM10010472_21720 [Pseudonocardia halophobica]|uniref:SPW repeat-containing integral membrane domain-containing protein n=1 Tax=Pseudonocardia halophobica TaxID=29401 RepID=A0A9W6NU49_9PSEU|nr:SPW repeat protein [Pseudonocardia halophobica]GLL09404.1 hypothetical protein GCM10017577_05440 [Pseudonocardia halophobica]
MAASTGAGGRAGRSVRSELRHDIRLRSALVLVVGAWLALSPLLITFGGPVRVWSQVGVGLALVVLGAVRVARPVRTAPLGLLNGALGVWVIVSAFVLHLQTVSAVAWTNNFFLGLLVVLLAVSGAVACSFAAPAPLRVHRTRLLHR